MAFAQLTYRESLRDIEACLRAQSGKLYHLGIHSRVSRSTLADANEVRDWRMYATEPFGVDQIKAVYALDSTTFDLCLMLLPWTQFRETKAVVNLHAARFARQYPHVPAYF